jgi:hypothetical protein
VSLVQIINAYFKNFTVLRWIIFTMLSMLVIASLATQAELFYWRHWPFEPIKIYSFRVLGAPDRIYHVGDVLTYEVVFEKEMDLTATVQRRIYNTLVHYYADTFSVGKELHKRMTKTFNLPLPPALLSGQHKLYWRLVYQVGPEKREIAYERTSEPFYVNAESKAIKGDPGSQGRKGDTGAKGKDFWGK